MEKVHTVRTQLLTKTSSAAMLGDCLELIRNIPDESVDMVLTDPPYGTTSLEWDSVVPFDVLWPELLRVTKKGAAIVMTASQPFTSALVMSNLKMFRHHWVWNKRMCGNSQLCKKAPLKIHEDVVVFSKSAVRYFPKMRHGPLVMKGYKRARSAILPGVEVDTRKKDSAYYPISVLEYVRPNRNRNHPTEKPASLFEYLIENYTLEGETVLDPFAGSFTTAIAAQNVNRNYICIEKDEGYFLAGLQRTKENKKKLDSSLFRNLQIKPQEQLSLCQ